MTQIGNFFLQCYFEQHLLYFLTTEYQFITITHDAINKIQWKNMDK